jgi:hypothetical protein
MTLPLVIPSKEPNPDIDTSYIFLIFQFDMIGDVRHIKFIRNRKMIRIYLLPFEIKLSVIKK